MRTTSKHRQSGFNLIEVIVAMALLAVVILAISSLFIQGGKGVKSGGNLSKVNALARQIMEDMDQQMVDDLLNEFGADMATTQMDVTIWNNDPPYLGAPPIPPLTDGYDTAAIASPEIQEMVDKWLQEIAKLPRSGGGTGAANSETKVTISMTGMYDRTDDADPANGTFEDGVTAVRVKVLVQWQEGIRPRRAEFFNVRTYAEL